ncbi:MAG: DNA polymerase/3'-5' exonuclease PolX [Candidatus Sungbacteria bacterium]|nr:DNA polymerase/3'-5' exonuclease PolX [bacterium]MDZ4260573.1 DNA polymerase/3'-5' exonuclease PolX [Candidatus Sungbacteria bacterium]
MTNRDITHLLFETSALLEMNGVAFKPAAYEKAALGVESLDREVTEIYNNGGLKALEEIPGVGKGIAQHLEDIVKTGTFAEYRALKKKVPVDVSGLLAIEGVGPKMIKVLWDKLRIRNLAQLERAARTGKIRAIPHFGLKSEQKILKGIEFLKTSEGRKVLGFELPEIRALEKMIQSFEEVEKAVVAGSVIRRKETIGDIDILAVSSKPERVMNRFVSLPFIAHVYAKGRTKTNVRLKNGLDADLRVVPKESFGAALNYFTGSKDHNIALRNLAITKGMKLNEYGLYKGKKMIAGTSEEDIYYALGLHAIPAPEMRENTGEIEASRADKLPKLIEYDDLKGDLQIQTNWTDGQHSIEEMAQAAQKIGLRYIAITDHTKSLAMTGGADEKKLARQMVEIEKLQKKFRNFRILTGTEVNIGKEGTLDINDAMLSKLDVVGAAIHSHFKLSRAEQTKRIIRAMENPHVDIIFHLTTRIINKREPIELDIDEIIAAAKRTKTVLEIDAYADRLDIKDDYIRKCAQAGVKMSIDSDAHSIQHFKYLEMGIAQARRGWAEKKDIINAWPVGKMLSMLK